MHFTPLHRVVDKSILLSRMTDTARAIAFWIAVVLPSAYLPLLWSGLSDWKAYLFFALVIVNVLTLVLGHDYRR